MGIKLTRQAEQAVETLLKQHKPDGGVLKVGVKAGGCAGLEYNLGLEDEKSDGDMVFEQDGGTIVVCDPKCYLHLNGIEVDYVESIMGSGFKFSNPNASKSCGCGTSFGV